MYSEKGEGKSRLKEIAMLIFYAKRFLPSGTTIEAKPFRTNTDMSTKYQCMKYFSRR